MKAISLTKRQRRVLLALEGGWQPQSKADQRTVSCLIAKGLLERTDKVVLTATGRERTKNIRFYGVMP